MSHQSYQRKWAEAMQELMEQVQIEYLPVESADFQVDFKHFALLYIKYLQIYKKLEDCYDQIIHPQKRRSIKEVLETVIVRLLEVKQQLVHFNPRPQNRFVALDEALTNFKLNPEIVDWHIPRYMRDDRDRADEIEVKSERLDHWLKAFGMSTIAEDLCDKKDPFQVDLTVEHAIRLLQKNERGRIGIQRAMMIANFRKESMKKEKKGPGQEEMSEKVLLEKQAMCASLIAAHWRRKLVQRKFQRMKQEEFVFLGMVLPTDASQTTGVDHRAIAEEVRQKRKRRQVDADSDYDNALLDELEWVKKKKGPDIRADLLEERRQFLVEARKKKGTFPASIDEFYKRFDALEKDDAAAPADDGKGKKDDKKKDDKKKDDKKDKKKKGDKAEPEETEEHQAGPTAIVQSFVDLINDYSEVWEDREESHNFDQKHDAELTRKLVFPMVEARLREQVDAQMQEELMNLKSMYDKAKKKKEKKKKGKKGKKDKGKKAKKWCVAVGMISNVQDCFPDLVEQEMIKKIEPCRLDDIVGDFHYLGAYQRTQETYCPPPSIQMVKSLVVEHCILPLSSLSIRQKIPYAARSILFYGPKGSGKTMFARAIASEIGATFFDISPSVIEGKYTMAKTGAALLIYKVFLVAQDCAPSVIYIDQIDQIFQAKKKKKGGDPDAPDRIKKDLVSAIKQIKTGADSTNGDRVLFVGCTSKPHGEGVDLKGLKDIFDEFVYLSFPDYGSSLRLWRHFIERKGVTVDPIKFNLSNLAKVSVGYTAGSIKQSVDRVLTNRRVQQLSLRQLQLQEFLGPLSRTQYTWPEEWHAVREFDHVITDEKDRREKALAALAAQ
ncbi:unnamed protein product [Amoebophrya sp. A120]|nr:unnamed protein product [Amoebophrya sp. A120]|eukprot:GSA120T00014916001.1